MGWASGVLNRTLRLEREKKLKSLTLATCRRDLLEGVSQGPGGRPAVKFVSEVPAQPCHDAC
jgi:hypothetical protein